MGLSFLVELTKDFLFVFLLLLQSILGNCLSFMLILKIFLEVQSGLFFLVELIMYSNFLSSLVLKLVLNFMLVLNFLLDLLLSLFLLLLLSLESLLNLFLLGLEFIFSLLLLLQELFFLSFFIISFILQLLLQIGFLLFLNFLKMLSLNLHFSLGFDLLLCKLLSLLSCFFMLMSNGLSLDSSNLLRVSSSMCSSLQPLLLGSLRKSLLLLLLLR